MADRPVETVHIADGPLADSQTRHVPDGPLRVAPTVTPPPIATQHVVDLPRFGRFQALAELGTGGMGTVYRAHDSVLGRAVAIKALHPQADKDIRERFLREAKAIGAVLHPNILAIYDAGTDTGRPFLVMELAIHGSLRDRLRMGPLSIDSVRELGIQIARALAAAHAAQILHRDIKPPNILATADHWKLADFGIARLPDSTLTVTGQFLGSPSYAAPESLRAGEFSPASDVYGLGATLYEALTGAPPHGDHEIISLVRKLEEDPPPVTERRDVPGPLGEAIMAALARDPAKRPSAEQLAVMLAMTDDKKQAPRSKLPLLALAAALAAIVMVALAVHKRTAKSETAEPVAKPAERRASKPPVLTAPAPPSPPQAAQPPQSSDHPRVVDENGNPVDEDTAQKILEQMEREAREEAQRLGRGHRRGHGKRDPWE